MNDAELNMRKILISFMVIAVNGGCLSRPVPDVSLSPNWPTLRTEFEHMKASDQAVRNEFSRLLTEARSKGVEVDATARKDILARMEAQDRKNQTHAFGLIDQHGWPPQSKVGQDAAMAAFLIVQHAPLDAQKKYLPQLRAATESGEASKSNLALLEDRILIREGKMQRYGTQADTKNGVSILPTEEEENLDERRKAMGLPPICDYLKFFVKQYGKVTYARCVNPPKAAQ